MFSQNEVEKYQQIKLSKDIKEEIIKNINVTHRRNRKMTFRFAAATACIILTFLGINIYLTRLHILSVESVPVFYSSRTIDDVTSLSMINARQDLQICIPLEVRVHQDAEISVSDGMITTNDEKNVDTDDLLSTICINESEDILWYISPKDAEYAQCKIVTNNKEYVYELYYKTEDNTYNIRQQKSK